MLTALHCWGEPHENQKDTIRTPGNLACTGDMNLKEIQFCYHTNAKCWFNTANNGTSSPRLPVAALASTSRFTASLLSFKSMLGHTFYIHTAICTILKASPLCSTHAFTRCISRVQRPRVARLLKSTHPTEATFASITTPAHFQSVAPY